MWHSVTSQRQDNTNPFSIPTRSSFGVNEVARKNVAFLALPLSGCLSFCLNIGIVEHAIEAQWPLPVLRGLVFPGQQQFCRL